MDAPEKNRALRARLGLTFAVYSDGDGTASRAWGVFDPHTEISLAATFVVARGGHIVFRYIGDSKTDRPDVDRLIQSVP